MLLTCPNCRSGLDVPDGTDTHVRCPSCANIFPAEAGAAEAAPVELLPPPPPPPAFEVVEDPPPPSPARLAPAPRRDPDEDDARPRRRRRRDEDDDDDDDDDDPPPPRRRVKRDWDDERVPLAERRAEKAAFARAQWGCRLVQLSFASYGLSLFLIQVFFIRMAWFRDSAPGIIVAAGVFGLINWVVGAVGVGLCLSGPKSPGHYRYGIGAAVAVGVHLVLLLVTVGKAELPPAFRIDRQMVQASKWSQVPTRMDSLCVHLILVVYSDRVSLPTADLALPLVTGLAEMIRLMLVLTLLSCLARAAGDEELSYKCSRAAGLAAYRPGEAAVLTLLLSMLVVETRAEGTWFAWIVIMTMVQGIYAFLVISVFPCTWVAANTALACEFPYETEDGRLTG